MDADANPAEILERDFEIERRFVGGMGQLFVVRARGSAERLAVKTLRPDTANPELVRRFQVEARAWMALGEHPNVVRALRYRELEGLPFLFLEYVDGVDLQVARSRVGRFPLAQALEFFEQMLEGLAHAHEVRVRADTRGLVHRDLKPANLLLGRDRVLKITDWGLVKVLGGTTHTTDGRMLGTLRYCAPEQLHDSATVDRRADLFSCGVLLHEWLSGEHTFEGESPAALVRSMLMSEPVRLCEVRPEVPPALDDLLARLLAKTREDRPADAHEVLAAVRAIPRSAAEGCARCGVELVEGEGRCPFAEAECPHASSKVPAGGAAVDVSPADLAIEVRAPAGRPVAELVPLPAGPYRFGPDDEPRSGPGFAVLRTPVTNAEFEAFLSSSAYRPDDARGFLRHWHAGKPPPALREHPVVWVNWHDASAYALWAGLRLPTWEGWEQAARGPNGWPYPWGETFDAARLNSREGGRGETSPVGTYPQGASPAGVLDLAGNVFEWTDTWRESDQRRTKVLCGGSWAVHMATSGLRATRNLFPHLRDYQTGFRCVRDSPPGGA